MLIFLDIETTGLDPALHGVLEIYARAVLPEQSWSDIEDFNVLIYPENYVWSSYCLKLHTENGLMLECLEKGKSQCEASGAYREWLKHAFDITKCRLTLAGKAVGRFDMPFLKHMCGDLSKYCHHNTLDMGSLLWKPQGSMAVLSLDELCRAGGMPKQRHRAKDDVTACVALYEQHLKVWARELAYAQRLEHDVLAAQIVTNLTG